MRQLHNFEQENPARVLGDAMYAEGIETTVKESREGGFALWVHDDDDLPAAQEMLAAYRAQPDDPRFTARAREARAKKRVEEREQRKAQKRAEQVKSQLERRQGTGLVTKFLLFGCIGFAVMAALVDAGDGMRVFRFLFFVDPQTATTIFSSLTAGEVWRLFTPMFIYPGLPSLMPVIHLFFDMWWLRTLAAPVEQVNRGRFLTAFVLVTAVVTGFAQALFGTPIFGGMAGVVAALFAYIWTRSKIDPTSPLVLPPQLAFWMLLWTVLALASQRYVPLRLAGFAVGGLWGYVHARLHMRRR